MSASSSFSCRGEGGGGGGRGRPGLVMNALTITHFKSRVYPWGMEKLVHRLGGNCLFLWPAAKGEEVNGKRYESVCPLRWWIRCKLEEEAFWSWALWLFLFVPLEIVFCLLLHSPFAASVSLFFVIFLFSSIFFLSSPSQLPPRCTGYEGVWVDRLSSGRSGGQGQHLQIVGQKAETARPSVRTQCAARIARPCRVTENRDLEPWAEKKLTQIHRVWHRNAGLPALQMCAHIGIWCFAQNGLDRTPHELLWKAFLLQCTTER